MTSRPSAPRPLDGRAAVVTGASRGIGRAVAEELARAGALLCVTARDAEGCARRSRRCARRARTRSAWPGPSPIRRICGR
ncbi:SDR family NAD(P)-dependent oxidoreductase [Streptomyces sp. Q6]|uniref:SDR family NAD(P)-dependent oxidoreductase n=1 Tax=Streptomyces citrinus TaxID=3118173 RepID=A0ACD5ALP2_9ACTN